ncbi:AAA family ATPase, partial [Bifidobacterium sp. UBA744]|uniref:AAA family ATPase n=1 Tax=Bifidobacterium sp. UBA744 TaxID=1946112 RepID=UPI0025C4FDFD
EKAHPDIFNTLLQVLDDGHLTDGQGRKVDFKNTIIILTTNLGSKDIAKSATTGFSLGSNTESSYQRMKDQVSAELKQQFRPEFLNRLDDIIVFRQLTEPQVRRIVDLDVSQLNQRLFDRHMALELTDRAKDLLAEKGFDPLLGARPLRRVIQRDVEDAISEKILMGDLEDGQKVVVDAEGEGILGEFTFRGVPFDEAEQGDASGADPAGRNVEVPVGAAAPADSEDEESAERSES